VSEAEKLLSLFESRFQAFGKRIADLADLSSKHDEMKEKMAQLLERVGKVEGDQSKSQENLNFREVSQGKLNDFLQKQLESHYKKLSEGLADHHQKLGEFHEMRQINSGLASKCIDLEKRAEQSFSLLSEQCKKQADLKISQDQSKSFQEWIGDQFKKIQADIIYLQEAIRNLEKYHNEQKSLIKEIASDLSDSKSKFEGYRDFLASKIDQKVSSISIQCDQKIKSIELPDVSKFIERKELEDLKHLIALSGLDSKNSLSKSNLQEMQLQILSKKIEGILIQLKSQELSK
jgi:hypothetical protein